MPAGDAGTSPLGSVAQFLRQPDFHQGLVGNVQLIGLLPDAIEQAVGEPDRDAGRGRLEVLERDSRRFCGVKGSLTSL